MGVHFKNEFDVLCPYLMCAMGILEGLHTLPIEGIDKHRKQMQRK